MSLPDTGFTCFVYICRSGISGSYHSSIFNFLRCFHTVFYNSSMNLHSHQQCARIPFFHNLANTCNFLHKFLLIIDILTGMKWYIIMVLICSSLMVIGNEDRFMYLCSSGEDSWESIGLQGDPTSPLWRRSALGFLWKEWC